MRWQIDDPLAFYQRLGTEREAREQMQNFTDAAIRNALASRLPEDIISGQRSELMDEIRDNLANNISGRGIEIIDVRIRRADLPDDVSERVFRRMEATRNQEAEQIRAEGDERALLGQLERSNTSKAGAAVLKCREALAEAEDALGKTLRAAKEMFDAGGGGGGGGGGVGGGAA